MAAFPCICIYITNMIILADIEYIQQLMKQHLRFYNLFQTTMMSYPGTPLTMYQTVPGAQLILEIQTQQLPQCL